MLEQLFGSKTRIKLLQLFLNNPDEKFYVREITRKIKSQINSVRRELENLKKIGIIVLEEDKEKKSKIKKKYYKCDIDFIFYPELKALLLKAKIMLERNLINEVKKIGNISYLVLTGIFVDFVDASTDVLIVGNVSRDKLKRLIKRFERELNHPVDYTVLSKQEFKYRKDITDRFLYNILENKKIVVIDKLEN